MTEPILVGEFVAQKLRNSEIFTIQKHDKTFYEAGHLIIQILTNNFLGPKMMKLTKVGSYIGTLGCSEV